jgi:RHS repeat-associated protein
VILFARQSYLSSVLLDLQPGLAVVLSETTGTNTTRYVHGPRGIHAQKDSANVWEHPLQDGLGSVRTVTDNAGAVLWATQYEPYGTGFGTVGTAQTNYGFTGEYGLPGGLLHLRARNYHPALGVFTALDPFEGMMGRAMSLNGYGWVEGNTPNTVDPSGMSLIGIAGSSQLVRAINSAFCASSSTLLLQGCDILTFILNGFRCPTPQFPPLATNTPQPTVTPPVASCDPSLLPSPADVFQQTFRTPAGTQLNPANYQWRPDPYLIRLTQYGADTINISDISQISVEQAYRACCGNGVVAIGQQIYRCAQRPNCDSNSPPPGFAVTPGLFELADNATCTPHPLLTNNTCAVPGRTGAVSTIATFIGNPDDNIGRVFVYFIPDNGSQPFPLYINDGGGGVEFDPNQIDVYVGRLQPETIIPVEGPSYSGLTGTACVLARPDINIPTPIP